MYLKILIITITIVCSVKAPGFLSVPQQAHNYNDVNKALANNSINKLQEQSISKQFSRVRRQSLASSTSSTSAEIESVKNDMRIAGINNEFSRVRELSRRLIQLEAKHKQEESEKRRAWEVQRRKSEREAQERQWQQSQVDLRRRETEAKARYEEKKSFRTVVVLVLIGVGVCAFIGALVVACRNSPGTLTNGARGISGDDLGVEASQDVDPGQPLTTQARPVTGGFLIRDTVPQPTAPLLSDLVPPQRTSSPPTNPNYFEELTNNSSSVEHEDKTMYGPPTYEEATRNDDSFSRPPSYKKKIPGPK